MSGEQLRAIAARYREHALELERRAALARAEGDGELAAELEQTAIDTAADAERIELATPAADNRLTNP